MRQWHFSPGWDEKWNKTKCVQNDKFTNVFYCYVRPGFYYIFLAITKNSKLYSYSWQTKDREKERERDNFSSEYNLNPRIKKCSNIIPIERYEMERSKRWGKPGNDEKENEHKFSINDGSLFIFMTNNLQLSYSQRFPLFAYVLFVYEKCEKINKKKGMRNKYRKCFQ